MKDFSEVNPHNYKTNPSMDKNLKVLYSRALELQEAIGRDLLITSGLRSDEQQQELIAQGKSNAPHSKHCAGAALDLLDEDGSLGKWALDNLDFLTTMGIWIEDPSHTNGWLHIQIMAPKSGKRVFIP